MTMSDRDGAAVQGYLAPGYEPVREAMTTLLADDPRYSAQFCAYAAGRPVVDLWGGPDASESSIQAVFSVTKAASAVCMALLVQRGVLDLDATMARYWPQFAQAGKESVTLRVALSHQAGLIGVEPQLTLAELVDHDVCAARLAAQRPHWRPGAAHGYHGLTIGVLMDELVRRTDGRTLARFFADEVAGPRGIDFFIAVPDEQEPRVVDVLPPAPSPHGDPAPDLPTPVLEPDSLTGMAFALAAQNPFDPPIGNLRAVRTAGLPAVGGAGSARGLARLFACCISRVDDEPPLLEPDTVAAMTQIQTAGEDLVLGMPTRYGVVFQKADGRLRYGSHQAFGHDGAAGAIAIGDPWHDLAYGYVPRRMCVPGGADERGLRLAAAVRACLPQGS